jgi:inner membrane protein
MDSLTQIALGAAVGTAVMGRRVGARAALWGALCGTLPDLDVLLSYGDPVRDFTFHRAESHALFWLTLVSPPLALLIHRLSGAVAGHYRGWLALVWLVLVTHALLDAFTVYGTQLLLPFSDYPVGLGSIFIIDPLYTLPLLTGTALALAWRVRAPQRSAIANSCGIALSSAYLLWSVAAQQHVEGVVHRALAATPLAAGRMLVTPAPFTTLLWRVVVMDPDAYHEGMVSLFDGPGVVLTAHASDPALLHGLRDEWHVQRLAWFSKGFYSIESRAAEQARTLAPRASLLQVFVPLAPAIAEEPQADQRERIVMTDLRMGQTPWFAFSFVVGARDEGRAEPLPVRQLPSLRPPADALPWLWRRIFDAGAGELPRPGS